MKINPVIQGSMIIALAAAVWPVRAEAQDLRRVFKHRDIWVENIGACPTHMTDRIIDLFQQQDREIRLINVNPGSQERPGNCRQKSVFRVYLNTKNGVFTYPGYRRMIERSGRFQPHSWGEIADLPFRLNDPELWVMEIDRGTTYVTAMNGHSVTFAPGTELTKGQTEQIVRSVHRTYRPDLDRTIQSDFYMEQTDPGFVTVSFTDYQNEKRTYNMKQKGRTWTARHNEKDNRGGQRPLGGSR